MNSADGQFLRDDKLAAKSVNGVKNFENTSLTYKHGMNATRSESSQETL